MIDDQVQVQTLMRQMEAQLPIPVYPTEAFIRAMKKRRVKLSHDQTLYIKSLLYMGDEGGIMCDVTPEGESDPILCSLTHLRVRADHPLAEAMQTYQQTRVRRLAGPRGLREPVSFTLRPRKPRRR